MASNKSTDGELINLILEFSAPLQPIETKSSPKLNPVKGLKALLFDIYGTLLISGSGEVGTASESKKGIPITPLLDRSGIHLLADSRTLEMLIPEEIERLIRREHERSREKGESFPEVDIRTIWRDLFTVLNDKKLIEGNISEENLYKVSLQYECLANPVWPMTGTDDLLQNLYGSSYKLGIVSNAQFYTEYILKALLDFRTGSGGFDENLLFYSYKEKMAKPSTEFFNRAVLQLKKLYNINPDEILYLGNDMLNDIHTAAGCGCRTALFAGDSRSLRLRESDERCRGIEPDLVITDMHQLIGILTEERI